MAQEKTLTSQPGAHQAPRKVDAKEDAKSRELRILNMWQAQDIFRKSQAQREGGPEFVFYDGPPTANGRPHSGHVITRVMKDVYPRYKAMKGYHTERKAGWDTHGLPVEIEIEKKYGISGKKQIQAFGVERFINECRNSVFVYEELWKEMSERLGYWVDMEHPYMTLSDDYIETVWYLLRQIFDKGYLYQGHRVSPYCPHCETTLSSHEVAQGYKDVKDLTVTAKFRVTGGPALAAGSAQNAGAQAPTYILAWTTTPWTLPSNVALAVNPDLTYVCFQSAQTGERYWVANDLRASFMKPEDTIVDRKSGRELVGSTYEPVFHYVQVEGKKFVVVPSGHVTAESGTGVVHMAPAFGEDDYRVCRENGVIYCNFVDLTGRFTDDVTDFRGRFVRDEDVNVDIVKHLAGRGLVFEKHKHEHAYPHCWRCDTPLLYYAIDSWFIQTTAVKEQMIANSNAVHWMPEHIKEGRFGNFLENMVDWNLSRSRYWGTPLPIWVCASCGHKHCVGSKAELEQLAGRLPQELHKPYIDDITWTCACGGEMRRVPEVIDAWFDSGSMPFGQLHYPFENQDAFERLYPADYICEAIDQTRGWFYSLLAISTLVTGQAPYKNVLVLGHVLDEEGKKMSKSKGNVIDPFEALDMHGADALRFYFLSNTQPWNSQRFYHKAVAESKAKFIDLLQNVHAFYALYAGIDRFQPAAHHVPVPERPLLDRWITARLHDTVRRVDNWLNAYDATAAARGLQEFVNELSTWYIRRSRDRFWAPGMEPDKAAAFLTLYECLETLSKLIAPFTPFIAEEIYQNVVKTAHPEAPESVHLCDFPTADAALIDSDLIAEMDQVLRVVESGRHLRNESKIKTRQPLLALFVPESQRAVLEKFSETLKDELNVKEVRFAALEDIAKPELYLNLKEVGKAYGKLVPVLNQAAKSATPEQVRAFQERGEVVLEGQTISRAEGHAEIRWHASFPGLVTVSSRGFVGLNTELTDELVEEGYVREIISKMQMMRKEVDYNVTDRVTFAAAGDAEVLDILQRNQEAIAGTVLIAELRIGDDNLQDADLRKDWDVNGKPLTLAVKGPKS
ncbi:isoleucine--tRNA ligase [Alicyclobacillus cycloheptanicus]|uniref:Isoleucine--tRNA ligase n=1 Tax=Alicyclobacillus cycloheptanicus TaxID=1457 RepID=A0ABT9XHV4_9BACL|nr:isoleucine--tRNA ligase [Alicyclobacillus cycloheptanicus]MDQ0189695.1 isoleucyl-tRNA synthetase [Alicyclobacillus cycloheptanicus]WDM01907.1 isoleucine--tRNA ligase [Alicyclobacillus cycloheptanicus]